MIIITKDDNQLPSITIETTEVRRNSDAISEPKTYIFPNDSKYEVDEDCLESKLILREGEFYNLFRGKYKDQDVLVKEIKKTSPDNYVINFFEDIELRKNIGEHNHIVNMIGCCTQKETLSLVTELPFYGSLTEVLRLNESLVENKLPQFAFQICKGVEFLVNKNVWIFQVS